MHNIKLVISYDGHAYLGWQKTQSGLSIEATLQKAIEQIIQHPAPLQAASRTDAGVHAKGQVVNFLTSHASLDLNKFRLSLNRLLPKDLVVLQATLMPLDFHPTLNCTGKEYHYFICYGSTQLPHQRFYSWHVPYALDLTLMHEALSFFRGTHSFAAFCNMKKKTRYLHDIREVQAFEMTECDTQRLHIRIRGNHFLYKMVRNLVGTLVGIGKKRISLEALPTILQSKQRAQAGVTAPAHGLFLYEVFYQ